MHQGFFVAIDGPSGIGKSTLTGLLADRLTAHGCSVTILVVNSESCGEAEFEAG